MPASLEPTAGVTPEGVAHEDKTRIRPRAQRGAGT